MPGWIVFVQSAQIRNVFASWRSGKVAVRSKEGTKMASSAVVGAVER